MYSTSWRLSVLWLCKVDLRPKIWTFSNNAKHTERNEWYPRGLQISLHIQSPGLQDYSEVWNLKIFWWGWGEGGRGVFWVTWNLDLGKKTKVFNFFFEGEGVFWVTWNLDLGKKTKVFNLGGYSGTPQIWTLWQFSFWGGFWDTSDLDSMTIFIWGGIVGHLGFGLSDNSDFGGVFWDTSDLDSLTILILGGGILGHLGFGLYDNFHWGGILGHLGFGLYDNLHFGGVFWDTSDLDSLTIFILGGILGHLGFGLYDNLHFGGVFWDTSDLDSLTIFILGGVFWDTLDLDSLTVFILGGGGGGYSTE